MKVLVANLGSTSFKYRLFEMGAKEEVLLASGGYERVTDFGEVIRDGLSKLENDGIASPGDIEAVGFKTVLGRNLSGCVEANDEVLAALHAQALPIEGVVAVCEHQRRIVHRIHLDGHCRGSTAHRARDREDERPTMSS